MPRLTTQAEVSNPKRKGYDFRVDNQLYRAAIGPGRDMTIQSSDVADAGINVRQNPEDFTSNIGRVFSRNNFSGGSNLDEAHKRGSTEKDTMRFWDSQGIDVFKKDLGESYNIQLLNTTDENRANEKLMLDQLKNGNSVEYFEGKGLFASILDNLGSGQTIRTVEEVYNLAKNGNATNFGIYGFSAEELIAAVDSGAISLDADFDEDTQSLMAVELVRVQANKSNSIMGAVTEAESDWRRLSDLGEIEKAAVLRFFPTLRNMPMNQFHNLQQDIALVYLDDIEQTNKTIENLISNKKSLESIIGSPKNLEDTKSIDNLEKYILAANPYLAGSEEAVKDKRQVEIRETFRTIIENGGAVPDKIRKALQRTKRTFNDDFNYLKK